MAAAADRAGTTVEGMRQVVELGILRPDTEGRFSEGDIRRVRVIEGPVASSIPLDFVASAIRTGEFWLDFVDAPSYNLLDSYTEETFEEASARPGVPLDLLTVERGDAAAGELASNLARLVERTSIRYGAGP